MTAVRAEFTFSSASRKHGSGLQPTDPRSDRFLGMLGRSKRRVPDRVDAFLDQLREPISMFFGGQPRRRVERRLGVRFDLREQLPSLGEGSPNAGMRLLHGVSRGLNQFMLPIAL